MSKVYQSKQTRWQRLKAGLKTRAKTAGEKVRKYGGITARASKRAYEATKTEYKGYKKRQRAAERKKAKRRRAARKAAATRRRLYGSPSRRSKKTKRPGR